MIEIKDALEKLYIHNSESKLSDFESLYKKNNKEFLKFLFQKLDYETKNTNINFNKLKLLIVFIQQWFPFKAKEEAMFLLLAFKLLERMSNEIIKNRNSHTISYILIDIIFHNPCIFDDTSIKQQLEFGRILELFANVKYDLNEDNMSDLYLTVHYSIGILSYMNEIVIKNYQNTYLNHFDNRIKEEFIDAFK